MTRWRSKCVRSIEVGQGDIPRLQRHAFRRDVGGEASDQLVSVNRMQDLEAEGRANSLLSGVNLLSKSVSAELVGRALRRWPVHRILTPWGVHLAVGDPRSKEWGQPQASTDTISITDPRPDKPIPWLRGSRANSPRGTKLS